MQSAHRVQNNTPTNVPGRCIDSHSIRAQVRRTRKTKACSLHSPLAPLPLDWTTALSAKTTIGEPASFVGVDTDIEAINIAVSGVVFGVPPESLTLEADMSECSDAERHKSVRAGWKESELREKLHGMKFLAGLIMINSVWDYDNLICFNCKAY